VGGVAFRALPYQEQFLVVEGHTPQRGNCSLDIETAGEAPRFRKRRSALRDDPGSDPSASARPDPTLADRSPPSGPADYCAVGSGRPAPRSRARTKRITGAASPAWPIPSVTVFVLSNSWAAATTKSPTNSEDAGVPEGPVRSVARWVAAGTTVAGRSPRRSTTSRAGPDLAHGCDGEAPPLLGARDECSVGRVHCPTAAPPSLGTGPGNRGNPPYERVRHYFFDMGNDSLLAFFEIPKGKEPLAFLHVYARHETESAVVDFPIVVVFEASLAATSPED
jgi:hypothetical protein